MLFVGGGQAQKECWGFEGLELEALGERKAPPQARPLSSQQEAGFVQKTVEGQALSSSSSTNDWARPDSRTQNMLKRPRKMHFQNKEEYRERRGKCLDAVRGASLDGGWLCAFLTWGRGGPTTPLATASPLMAPRQLPPSTLTRCPPTAL